MTLDPWAILRVLTSRKDPMSKFRFIAIASLCLSAAIDADEDRSRPRIQVEAINPWTHLDLVNDPENFQFAIVTDRTGGHRAGDMLEREGVLAVGVPTPTGHAYEVSVPLSYIEAQQGKDWDRIRINIAVDDFDETTGPLAQLWWQPDWRDEANFPGSGTFRRPQK